MLVELCAGFAIGVMVTLAFMDVQSHEHVFADLRTCMRQFEAMESYFVSGTGELRVHCKKGFLTFVDRECIGYRPYRTI